MAAPKVGINQRSFRQKLAEYRHQPLSLFLLIATLLAAAITVFILFSLILYILVKGIPAIRPEMFAWKYTTTNNSMMPSIINTLEMVVLTLIMAVPVGVCSAIYLVEYAKRGNKLVKVVRMTTETLQGIPSIVWLPDVCRCLSLWVFAVGRCNYIGIDGAAADYADNGRSVDECSGFVPGGQFWFGSRQTADGIQDYRTKCHAGNFVRCHSGNRSNCRRNSRLNVYRRNSNECLHQSDGNVPNTGGAYVSAAL